MQERKDLCSRYVKVYVAYTRQPCPRPVAARLHLSVPCLEILLRPERQRGQIEARKCPELDIDDVAGSHAVHHPSRGPDHSEVIQIRS